MSRALQDTQTLSSPGGASPFRISTDELEGPLCALSLYLSVAEGELRGAHGDCVRLARALQGARAEVEELAKRIDAACRGEP